MWSILDLGRIILVRRAKDGKWYLYDIVTTKKKRVGRLSHKTVRYGDQTVEADFKIDETEMLSSMTNTMDRDLAYAAHISFNSLGFEE